jgi:hypothetical protein
MMMTMSGADAAPRARTTGKLLGILALTDIDPSINPIDI